MDIASVDLNAVPLPIPTAARLFVFLASGRDPEMEHEWTRWGGTTTFLEEFPETCGVCIFRRGFGAVSLIQPFLDRAGKESNIFCFDPFSKKFQRIGFNWLEIYSTVIAT